MQRTAFFVYGVVCHVLFLGLYAYMAGFFGNLLVPKSVDSGPIGPVGAAVAINLLLVSLFAVQHSIMARPWFKSNWTRIVPKPIERSTYVLLSCVVLVILMWQWRPMDAVVWQFESGIGWWTMTFLFALGWFGVPAVSLMINHFDLFGTRQVWLHLQGKEYEPLPFRTPLAYGYVRHPLYVAWAFAFWATPTMTVGHALLAASLTAYMLVAVIYEERDLVAHFGAKYTHYRQRVPRYIPLRRYSVPEMEPVTVK